MLPANLPAQLPAELPIVHPEDTLINKSNHEVMPGNVDLTPGYGFRRLIEPALKSNHTGINKDPLTLACQSLGMTNTFFLEEQERHTDDSFDGGGCVTKTQSSRPNRNLSLAIFAFPV